jgi:S-DNA-T family DNA segregation ATPase FtsK/SpoIIIE
MQIDAMPFIATVVDELSDAMLAYPKEIESSITRITQMGAPVGIHLIIATSNTSTKVLTNSIKTNNPARIIFQVISEAESRCLIEIRRSRTPASYW